MEAEAASTEAQERCTMWSVQIVASSARFPSSLMAPGQCTARSATRSTGLPGRPGAIKTI